jgi:hypothetical protein
LDAFVPGRRHLAHIFASSFNPTNPEGMLMALREQGPGPHLRRIPECDELQDEIEFQRMLATIEIMMRPQDDR